MIPAGFRIPNRPRRIKPLAPARPPLPPLYTPASDPPLHEACLPFFGEDSRILVGLSGGRDSVALLRLLVRRGCAVEACHVHHGIRGAEADHDANFARSLSETLGVNFHECRVDVPELAGRRGLSLETAAREARHEALAACACQHGCTAVALAHHLGDQAETVLFRLCRGSAGPVGMKPVRFDAGGMPWLRPLLERTREELTRWLVVHGWAWREDSTNAALDAARNRLRHEALPALRRALGRDVRPILARSARLGDETREALAEALEALRLEDPRGRLYLPAVLPLPPRLQKAALHHYLARHEVCDLNERTVEDALAMLSPNGPARLSLRGGMALRRKEKRMWIELPHPGGQDCSTAEEA